MATSLGELAAVHGVSKTTIWKWVRDPRWHEAGFSKSGPWPAREIARQRAWRIETLRDDPAAGGGAGGGGSGDGDERDLERAQKVRDLATGLKVAQIKKLVAQEELLQVEIQEKRRLLVKREEAEEAAAAKWRSFRQALQELPKALRQVLADETDPGRVEEIMGTALRAVCMKGFEK